MTSRCHHSSVSLSHSVSHTSLATYSLSHFIDVASLKHLPFRVWVSTRPLRHQCPLTPHIPFFSGLWSELHHQLSCFFSLQMADHETFSASVTKGVNYYNKSPLRQTERSIYPIGSVLWWTLTNTSTTMFIHNYPVYFRGLVNKDLIHFDQNCICSAWAYP